MIVYSQRLKFSIILGVLLISIFSVFWYSDNLNTKMEYIDRRIDFLDDQIIEGSMLPIKIENSFSKYNSKIAELDFFKNPSEDKIKLEEKIRGIAKVNDVIINQIYIKNTKSLSYADNLARIENIPFVKEKIELNATGNFLDIGLFLERIIKDAKNLNLNKCDFVLDENNDRQVKASLEFYTYYIEKIWKIVNI